VLIATVYDEAGVPRRHRRVEWTIEGPGGITEVDGNGELPDRGLKLDNKSAFSFTDYFEHRFTRGSDEFTIGPGQTWCVLTSAVEGETTVTAHAPGITDRDNARAYARVNWGDDRPRFPPPVTARAGTEHTLDTRIKGSGDSDYRIRYRIIDGPPAALASARGGPVDSVTEAVAPVSSDGMARVQISQPAPAAGTNRIAIEVIKPSHDHEFIVVSKGETKVTWQTPDLGLTVSVPKSVSRSREVPVTYQIAGLDDTTSEAIRLTATIPPGLELVRTEPRATVDGDELSWTLPAGKQLSTRAIYRPLRLGEFRLGADVRTRDGMSAHGSASVVVSEAKLQVRLDGPRTSAVGETVPFKAIVTNTGNGPAERIVVHARLDQGLEPANKARSLDQTIASLAPGQSKTVALPVSGQKAGKFTLEAGAGADGDLVAAPQSTTLQVQDAQLSVSVHGPARGYIGQEVTWQIFIRNTGELPLDNVVVRAAVPPDVRFVKATDGGKSSGRQVVWDMRRMRGGEERSISLTGVGERSSGRAAVTAIAIAVPAVESRTGTPAKTVTTEPPAVAPFEVIGVPALQLSVKDSTDPVVAGQRTTYTIRVKNAGTLAARNVVVSAQLAQVANPVGPEREEPELMMKPLRATGPKMVGKIEKHQVTFPQIDSLAPNAEATLEVEVQALVAGDARFRAEVRSPQLTQPLRAEEPTRILGRESRPTK
jgi:uncharacterized repeat protein (TIGR01451 family)